MNGLLWIILLVPFAVIGAVFVVHLIVKGVKVLVGIVRDLAATLREAVGIAREFRADFAMIRQLAAQPQVDAEFFENQAQEKVPKVPVPFPAPIAGLYREKPPEPEAPPEKIDQVDVTAEEEDLLQEDQLEQLRLMGMKTEAVEAEFKEGRGVDIK